MLRGLAQFVGLSSLSLILDSYQVAFFACGIPFWVDRL